MKFGLTAYLPGTLTEQGIKPSDDETALLFRDKDGSRGFHTVIGGKGREYAFVRVK